MTSDTYIRLVDSFQHLCLQLNLDQDHPTQMWHLLLLHGETKAVNDFCHPAALPVLGILPLGYVAVTSPLVACQFPYFGGDLTARLYCTLPLPWPSDL